MSQLWSEINKVVSVLAPVALTSGASVIKHTDVVHLENYKKCSFLVTFGVAANNRAAITVNAYSAATTGGSAVAYYYRTQVTKDTPSAATAAATIWVFPHPGGP